MKILCNLNLFTLHQNIYLMDDNGIVNPITAVELEALPGAIVAICHEYDTNTVVLSGNVAYSQSLAENICEFSLNNYNGNTIKVEVI